MNETIKGLIADQGRTYGYDDPVRSRDLNRWQKDLARLSWAQQKMGVDLHYPHVATSDNKFQAAASADKVSLDTGVRFVLAGVPFDTTDLDSADLEFDIPDNSTRFLRAALASDCGTAVLDDPEDPTNKNWVVTRELKLSFSLVGGTEEDAEGTGGGPSSPESMRILKAVKAEAGTSPTITLYENSGHGHVVTDLSDYYTQAQVDALLTAATAFVRLSSPVQVLSAGAATDYTSVTCSPVPDGATMAWCLIQADSSGTSHGAQLWIKETGWDDREYIVGSPLYYSTCPAGMVIPVVLDSSKQFAYKWVHISQGPGDVDIIVIGYGFI